MPQLRLITDHDLDPTLDVALTTAVLRRVASGEIGPTLRVFTPERTVAFGAQDRTRNGYPAAVAAANDLDFAAVERLAGGRAAVFHEGTVAFAWSTPQPDPKAGIEERFEAISSIVIDALSRLGIAGVLGEVPGEYCPGRHSVHVDGRKVMGVGQRLVGSGAHVGGVLVVHSPDLVNRPLIPVYRALGYDWDPNSTGAIGTTVGDAADALTAAFISAGHSIQPAVFESETRSMAADVVDEHRPRIR